MATEIERKFLTTHDHWKALAPAIPYRQGYMNSDRGHQVLIKTISSPGRTSGFIEIRGSRTIHSPSHLILKPIELLIPLQDAIELQTTLCFNLQEKVTSSTTEKIGYLSTHNGHTLRARIAGSQGIFTIKAKSIGISRAEFEFEIPVDIAEQLLNSLCEKPQIEKTRRKILYKKFIWEVDEFLGDNLGLVIAEIELQSETQSFTKPDWVGLEVTGDKRYNNSALAQTPYTTWPKDCRT